MALLLIVRTGDVPSIIAERHGQFVDWIHAAIRPIFHGDIVEVDARHPSMFDLADASALILTGSPSSVSERSPWMLALEEQLRLLVAQNKPVLGICFGHQLLAQALGGAVQRNPRGREIGTVEVELLADDPLFAGLPPRFLVNASHVDTVCRLPEGARVLARTRLEETAAYAVGSAWGVQFHPELGLEATLALLEARRPILEGEGLAVDAMVDAARHTPAGTAILQNFIRLVG